jgi:hypothetical protein
MNYKYYLILFIVCLLNLGPVLAQDTRYRVEVLVLTHLDHNQQPKEIKHPADFSAATDFLTPPEEEPEEGIAEEEPAGNEIAEQEIIEEVGEAAELPEEPDPNALVHIEEMSDVMREAWRRLRLSGPFRPEQYLAWEQGSEEPFPALRIHDLEVVMVDDPYAELRRELLEQALEEAVDEEQTTVFADAAGLDALNETEEPELPDPTLYYRLDGAVSLKRTRFLHLGLDLQLRDAIWDDGMPVVAVGNETELEQAVPSAFLVHGLQQSRQVKTRRMEYFDGPVLSVLAFITSIKVETRDPP